MRTSKCARASSTRRRTNTNTFHDVLENYIFLHFSPFSTVFPLKNTDTLGCCSVCCQTFACAPVRHLFLSLCLSLFGCVFTSNSRTAHQSFPFRCKSCQSMEYILTPTFTPSTTQSTPPYKTSPHPHLHNCSILLHILYLYINIHTSNTHTNTPSLQHNVTPSSTHTSIHTAWWIAIVLHQPLILPDNRLHFPGMFHRDRLSIRVSV